MMPTPEQSIPAASPSPAVRPPRVLACVLCQQRKVKCDRKFPCANCVKHRAQCVPVATRAPRQRRRRFAERDLLDKLHSYESLLRQHHIEFEPLHEDSSTVRQQTGTAGNEVGYDSSDDGQPKPASTVDQSSTPSATSKSETVYKAKCVNILDLAGFPKLTGCSAGASGVL